jgi:hypothetical protein
MTIIPLAIINCTVVELLLQVFALVYVSYGEQHCITTPIYLSIGNNVIPPQLLQTTIKIMLVPNLNCQCFISSCRNNDTHVLNYANPVELLWEFTVCQGVPRHLLQLAEKIYSIFLWATRHRVGFTHCTTRDQDEREA